MEKLSYSDSELAAKRNAAALTDALAALGRDCPRLPSALAQPLLYALVCSEPDVDAAWAGRDEQPEKWADTLRKIAAIAENIAGRIEAEADVDDDGIALLDSAPYWRDRVAIMRKHGKIALRIPAVLIVGGLIAFLAGRPGDSEILEAGERDGATERQEDARNMVLSRAADRLAEGLREFKTLPQPSVTDRILRSAQIKPRDLYRMGKAEFDDFKLDLADVQNSV